MSDPRDYISRIKRPSPIGTSTLIGLRTLDIFVQYRILARGLASPLLSAFSITPTAPTAPIIALGLPLKPLLIFGMSVGAALKQIFWISYISKEEMPTMTAVIVA